MLRGAEGRQAEGHAPVRMLLLEVGHALDAGAGLRAVDGKVETPAGQGAAVGPGVTLLEGQDAVKHAGVPVGLGGGGPLVEHRVEALVAPRGVAVGVEAKAVGAG